MSSCASCRQCTKLLRLTRHSASDSQRAGEEQGTKPKCRQHFHTSAFSHFKPSKSPAWTQTLRLLSSFSLLSAWFSVYTQSVSLMYDPLATNVDDGTIPSCWEQDFHGLPDLDSRGNTRVLAAAAAPLDVLFERDFWPGTDHKPAVLKPPSILKFFTAGCCRGFRGGSRVPERILPRSVSDRAL